LTRHAILWRHGRTEWNHAQRFQGQLDVPLDDVGREQASRAAAVLAHRQLALIVSSDLSRATATASALAEVSGRPVISDPDLREAHAGRWQGRTHAEIAQDDGPALDRWRTASDVRPGGDGETRSEVAARVAAAVNRHMAAVPADGCAVFVTHGGAARAAVAQLLGLALLDWQRMAVLRNCAWAVLEVDRFGSWRLESYNAGLDLPGVAPFPTEVRDGIV